ncbi:hypothetical protein [Nocardia sp. NPDC050435]|uniref:hypothetical protein n=1 Tax=Nocardia sp. NPDC050435 TaxID=3155040 RepID=UPI0033E42398
MTQQHTPPRPSWSELIQNRAAWHTEVLSQGPLDEITSLYDEVVVTVRWRMRLMALDLERRETEWQARAEGLSRREIAGARARGRAGLSAGEQQHTMTTFSELTDRDRVTMRIADDVFVLEHMALVAAAHGRRVLTPGGEVTELVETEEALLRNMAALWQRMRLLVQLERLSSRECWRLWGPDNDSWRTLLRTTVPTYTDAELERWWQAHASPGIREEIHDEVVILRTMVDALGPWDHLEDPLAPTSTLLAAYDPKPSNTAPAPHGTDDTPATRPDPSR